MGTTRRKSILVLRPDYDEINRISRVAGRTITEQLHLILDSWKKENFTEETQYAVEAVNPLAVRATEHLEALRRAVCEGMLSLEKLGLNTGTSGNLSVRTDDGFLITPSGFKPVAITPEKVVQLDSLTVQNEQRIKPSSEWRFHKDIYAARMDINAVVHVHSTNATALACQRRSIPPFHYMVAVAGGNSIRCAPYAAFGTPTLSDGILRSLDDRRACLMANHGMVALGESIEVAIDLAVEVEELARQYAHARIGGEPILLSESEMAEVLQKFEEYGTRGG